MDAEPYCVCLITTPTADKAAEIARVLVEERLAACVNIVPQVRSIYRWQGRIEDEAEALMVVKTARARFAALQQRVHGLHPYTTPEVIALPLVAGAEKYLRWLGAETAPALDEAG
ncbi:MAG: divalent-cation tolerance protein CutA [Planctomycetota bacterium]|nr:MAG: divalent-cation tolerance protein CutA [Planctomycetota bacterium]